MPVEAVLIGAGTRGTAVYGGYALARPERLRIVAVAEPVAERREAFAAAHGLAAGDVHPGWEPLLSGAPRAPVAIVCTSDTEHVEPALAALAAGYDVILEKPMAPDPRDCLRVVEAAEAAGRVLQIGHVLRYTPFYERVHRLLEDGAVGRVHHLELKEHVATWHMTHSFVRGKFRNGRVAAPILLAKSCHDLDLLCWLADTAPRRLSAAGGRDEFRSERAPEGAPERCTDGCPAREACPHDAERFYLGPDEPIARIFPWSDVSRDPSREARRRGLETGPYGRCVYRCDNDQPDHQVVTVDFEDGKTAVFTMHGLASHEERTLRISGSHGELRGCLHRGEIEVHRHGGIEPERIRLEGSALGHFGGDVGLLDHFTGLMERGDRAAVRTSGASALESHLLGFAAEQARRESRVIEWKAWRNALSAS